MKIFFVSLGCDKNLVDSEMMLGMVKEAGYEIVTDENEAEIIVINTCCFIHDAKEESVMTILEMAQLKKTGNLKILAITGCLAQRYYEEMKEEIPEIDIILGTSAYMDLINAIEEKKQQQNPVVCMHDFSKLPDTSKIHRVITTGTATAYLKIAEGCNKNCTYCIIPKLRGRYLSVPMEQLVKEAKELAQNGIKELILVAQETTIYGTDLYGKKMLPELLNHLCEIEGIEWIRLLYCYPEEITEELLHTMRKQPKICHYLDMPIQHCENEILRKMGRRTNKEELMETIKKIREILPDAALRTTLITGFPGETTSDHENLLDFINEIEFDRLGAFTYSKEEDTKAALMKDQIDDELKEQRRAEIMELQQEISFDKNREMIGKRVKVLIEGYLYDEDVYIGRTYKDAPKVDGNVFVHAQEEIISGDFVEVTINESNEYDLIGDVYYGDEFTE